MNKQNISGFHRLVLRSNLRYRIFTDMKLYRLSFKQLSALIDNKVTPDQLENFVRGRKFRGRKSDINGLHLMEICTILGIRISSIHEGYFLANCKSKEEIKIIDDIYNKSREIDMAVLKDLEYSPEKKITAQDLLKGNTLIVGKPGMGKTYLTMELIKDLRTIRHVDPEQESANIVKKAPKILILDREIEYKDFANEMGGTVLDYEVDKEFPELNSEFTVLIPKDNDLNADEYEYIRNNTQAKLEKILKHALDNEVDLLLITSGPVSYSIIENIAKFPYEYWSKIKIIVQIHSLRDSSFSDMLKNNGLLRFKNIIAFSCDQFTADTLGFDRESLENQKRGEYQVRK